MRKNILIIIIFVAVVVVVAILFTIFFVPTEKIRYSDCILLQNPATQQVDCFGCTNNICKDAPADWGKYLRPEVGIPYACFKNENGCQLAQ
ncbi:MAG: hypothetical protein NTX82_06240 [Candidatus Parcubacteria bacterium]|nr:hypothetical protein [Candidatus Parcubacteria bacterium]